jgi:hypothetical protein
MFLRTQTVSGHVYLLLVENERVDGHVRQRVVQRFGQLEALRTSGQLDAIVAGLGRFSERLAVLGAVGRGTHVQSEAHRIGGPLVFEQLWESTGVADVVREAAAGRHFGFSLERAVFLTVLHRLLAPGSDRAAERWKDAYQIAGTDGLQLHQLYRAMAWLGEVLPAAEQRGATPFAPRTRKDLIEERLFARRHTLFSDLSLVFFDTTSIYFEGEGGETIGHYGHSKDHRPDRKQMVVGAVLDLEGRPLCCEIWPGHTTDVKTLLPIVDRLRTRFQIGEVCIVADRGMISQAVIDEIDDRDSCWYILGVRMRAVRAMRDLLAADDGPYQEVFPRTGDKKRPAPLKVRGVRLDDRDYVLCLNEDEATKDRHDREAIVAALRDALRQGDTALVGNKGYRRYLASRGHRFEIDEAKVLADARFDGKWVLTTNTGLDPETTALAYKQLWTVESLFRSMKSVLETRPVYHKCDETIRGHVFCSFLALVLRKALEDRLAARHWKLEWHDILQDLDRLEETTVTIDAKGYVIRTDPRGTVGKVFQASGTALPPVIRPC